MGIICRGVSISLLAIVILIESIECRRVSTGYHGDKHTIYVAGFFPIAKDKPIGRGVLPAVELALKHIDSNRNVLKGYHLDIMWNNTKVKIFLPSGKKSKICDDLPSQ